MKFTRVVFILFFLFFFEGCCDKRKVEKVNLLETLKSDGYWLYDQIYTQQRELSLSKKVDFDLTSLAKKYTKNIYLIKSYVVSRHESISELSTDTIDDNKLKKLDLNLKDMLKEPLMKLVDNCLEMEAALKKIEESNCPGECVPYENDIDYDKIINYEEFTEREYLLMLYKCLNTFYKGCLCVQEYS